MKKIIILLLCCGLLVSMVGCGDNTSPTEIPLTTVSETVITEMPTETIPPTTAAEPIEKGKESPPTESKDQATELTTTTTEPKATAAENPKEETKPTQTTKPTVPSAAENAEPKEDTPPKAEEPQEEIYQGIQ